MALFDERLYNSVLEKMADLTVSRIRAASLIELSMDCSLPLDPSGFCRGQTGKLSRCHGDHAPAFHGSLVMALNLCHCPGLQYCFCFTVLANG